MGWLALRAVGDFVVEVLVTLGLVLACTAVATHLHVSAPLAAVAAGLLVGLARRTADPGGPVLA